MHIENSIHCKYAAPCISQSDYTYATSGDLKK